jgi:putative exporter of polyketide antibiotics
MTASDNGHVEVVRMLLDVSELNINWSDQVGDILVVDNYADVL